MYCIFEGNFAKLQRLTFALCDFCIIWDCEYFLADTSDFRSSWNRFVFLLTTLLYYGFGAAFIYIGIVWRTDGSMIFEVYGKFIRRFFLTGKKTFPLKAVRNKTWPHRKYFLADIILRHVRETNPDLECEFVSK